jgi:hypothetical protein
MTISSSNKLFLLSELTSFHRKGQLSRYERDIGATLMVLQTVLGALVPVLIPLADSYHGVRSASGIDMGKVFMFLAIGASILSTAAAAVEKARKSSKMGHITNQSVAEDEWLETHNKLQTMLQVLEPIL